MRSAALVLLTLLAGVSPAAGSTFGELAEQARTFFAEGSDAKAMYALEELDRTDPALFRANGFAYLAGILANRLHRDDVARRYLTVALSSRELADYATRELAALERRLGNFDAERGHLQRVASQRSSLLSAEATYEHAMSYFRQGDFEKAYAELTGRALSGRDVLVERVQCLRSLGRHAEASRLVGSALRARKQPDSLPKALGLIELDDDAEVIQKLSNDDLMARAMLCYENRNFERALLYLRMLHDERGVASQKLVYTIGRSLDGAGRKNDALAWFAQAEGSLGSSYHFYAIWFQGEILFKRQEFLRAADVYRRALSLAPTSQNDLSTRLRIMQCQILSGQKDRAAATVREILDRHRSMAYRLTFMNVKDMASAGNHAGAIARLTEMVPSAPASLRPELFFWKASLHEQMGNLGEAIGGYDLILRLYPQSFHATLASSRLADPALGGVSTGYEEAWSQAQAFLTAKRLDDALKHLTYMIRRYPAHEEEISTSLRSVYERLPRYRDFLKIAPFPSRFTITSTAQDVSRTRSGELSYLGFFGDAAKEMDAARGGRLVSIETLYTIADHYHRGGLPYLAMRRAESLGGLVPRDFVFELLPQRMRELLYPVHYRDIVESCAPQDLDRALLYALIREESRFDARAHSPAGARGLLQFIPSTASFVVREMGRGTLGDDDLYDPALSIQLGAYYITRLARQFTYELAPILASYNAGEEQGKLWLRMAGSGKMHEYLSEVNYPETQNYIMRIMTGYERYRSTHPGLAQRAPAPAAAPATAGRS